MKWRLVIRPRAQTDLREAQDWYESQRAGLGEEFIAEIEAALRALVRDPERYTVYYRGFSSRIRAPVSVQAVVQG